MKPNHLLLVLWLCFGVVLTASSQTTSVKNPKTGTDAAQLAGRWQGTFGGAVSGKCEMEFTRETGGKITGRVAIQPDGSEMTPFLPFDSVTLDGNNLKASFNDSNGGSSQLDGTLENGQLKGTWKSSTEGEGTWQVDKSK